MNQTLESPKILKKTFVPDLELLELADSIRNLKSTQIVGRLTLNDQSERRCVLGALGVEKFGIQDSILPIDIWEIPILKRVGVEYKAIVYSMFGEDECYGLADKLAAMNNTGRSFAEIADWVELESFHHGEWK